MGDAASALCIFLLLKGLLVSEKARLPARVVLPLKHKPLLPCLMPVSLSWKEKKIIQEAGEDGNEVG